MVLRKFWTVLGVVCALLLLSLRSDAAQEVRVALVIANGDYAAAPGLPNPVNDARAVAEALGRAGFSSIVRPAPNLTHAGMMAAINTFAIKARSADVAVIYYAGHGIEIEGRNYLVPVDARFDRAEDVDDFTAVPLELVLKSVDRARRLKLVILDACRNNPFASRWALAPGGGKKRSFGRRGLAPVPVEGDTLVAYAAEAGTEASDGPANGNSPFVRALVSNLVLPGVEVRLMFGRVRDDVVAVTKGSQRPFLYGSMGGDEFYFVPKPEPLSPGTDPATGKLPGQSFRDCDRCPELVVVPAGSFVMGSPAGEEGRYLDEGPQRMVTIARAFAVGKFEVTFGEWDACVAGGGCRGYRPSDEGYSPVNTPVINVSWDDAKAYVSWINTLQTAGKGKYRLLSEAEWEYAARAGTTTPYPWGTRSARDFANYGSDTVVEGIGKCLIGGVIGLCGGTGGRDQWQKLSPRGSFPANGFGLFDMHGNVWEWTEDCYNGSYVGAPSDGSARRSGDCSRRVLRGGSWFVIPQALRSAIRGWNSPSGRYNSGGFRVARTL
jgi:formylglycine-generating enzyme required for sulfatase activity